MKCLICGFVGKSLGKHLSATHSLTSPEYIVKYPGSLVKCEMTRARYSEQNRDNGNWITRAKDDGDDLAEYRMKMGEAVSEAIMANPDERARRSQQMAANNRTDEAKEKSRNTAKKTSARPEILAQRTARLKQWRDENFDVFYEKCVVAMHNTWVSKPERILRQIVQNFCSSFQSNQRLHDVLFTSKSHRKQLDLYSRELGVIIEFDGPIHFSPLRGNDNFDDIIKRDNELNAVVVKKELTLIRVGHDQFTYREGGKFNEAMLKVLFNLLKNPTLGVYYLGSAYGERNLLVAQRTSDQE